jgi:hypothetical protein
MKHDFSEIELAYDFVSSDQEWTCFAVVNRESGKIYYKSEMSGLDDFPEDVEDSDEYVSIPHKNDLELGRNLVFDFVRRHIPEQIKIVEGFFRQRGAYSNYKSLLERIGKLDAWQTYEKEETQKALRGWCAENGIELK